MSPATTGPGVHRPSVYGPEPWAVVGAAEWSWWDLWFCVVAVADFGDLDGLEADLAATLGSRRSVGGLFREDVEAKLSHLADLRARLVAAGVDAADLVAAGKGPGVLSRARTKVLKKSAYGSSSMPTAMVETPRARLERRARRGYWASFPVDPTGFYDKFRRTVEGRDFVGERRTLTLARQLSDRLERFATSCRGPAEELALYRSFHAAGLELADRADDSFGSLGDLRIEAFEAYVGIDWAAARMPDDAYWQDLCELLTWEPYALTHRRPTLPFLHAKAIHADMIDSVLFGLAEELRSVHLGSQADEALELVAWMHIAGRRYNRYLATAQRLGSERAGPVLALAESAVRGHKPAIALAVFRAADRPGRDQDRLRARCVELTGVHVDEAG